MFFNALRERIDSYFSENKIDPTGNFQLYSKAIIFISVLIFCYVYLVFFTPGSILLSALLCAILGFDLAAIGFNVMHDGSHGSYSNNKWVNKMMAYTLNMMGGNAFLWNQKHNLTHHSYTNIEGIDDDIDIRPWIRCHEDQPRKWFHKFQHIYCLPLYGMTHFFWVYIKDFKKYFTGKVAPGMTLRKMDLQEHLIFWISKIFYFSVFIIIPMFKIGLIETIAGYMVVVLVSGFFLATVFQLAHVVEGAHFVAPPTDDGPVKIESEWAVHQVSTTANFATKSRITNWFLGGLNFQIEHHLFPRISHIHYPKISKIVRETCREFNLNYLENPTVFLAMKSHLLYLKRIGVA